MPGYFTRRDLLTLCLVLLSCLGFTSAQLNNQTSPTHIFRSVSCSRGPVSMMWRES